MSYPAGVDFSTFVRLDGQPGMDPSFVPMASGVTTVLEHIVRRWIIVPGEMHDKTIGAALFSYVNRAMTPLETGMLQARLREQALMVEGVEEIQVFARRPKPTTLEIVGQVTLGDNQKWTFVFALTSDKVELITLAAA